MTARMILALAVEADDKFIWDRLRALQPEMFSAGALEIKFCYFGAEGMRSSRPYVVTQWTGNASDLAHLMDRARSRCVCGCFIEVGDILEQALEETRQGSVQAIVIVADQFHGDLDHAVAIARKLRAAGTRLFVLQQGRSIEPAFALLAETTDGACIAFNPHIERLVERLPGTLEAIAHYAIGGLPALQAKDTDPALLLLEQMNRLDVITQGKDRILE